MTTMNGGDGDNNDNNDHNKQQQQPQIDDAKNFLERVKEAFKNTKGVYDRFVEIMKNFKHDRLNTGGVIKEVQDLFSGHDELFVGFQNFLPAVGLVTQDELREIQQNMTNSANRNGGVSMHGIGNGHNNVNPDFNMAVSFICKIKQRFGSHRRIYQEFLQILQHFQTAAQANDTSVIKNVKSRIRALFREHPDLLEQFDYFLPPLTAHFSRNAATATTTTATASIPRPESGAESTRVNGRKRRADSDLENQPDSKRRRHEDTDKGGRRNHSNSKYKRRHRVHKKNKGKKERPDSDMDDDEITFSDGDVSSVEREPRVSDGGVGDEHQGLRIFSKLRKDIPDHLYKHVLTLTQLYPMGLTEFSVVGKLICDALREHGHTELMKEFQRELSSSKQSWFFRSRGQNYYEYLTNNILLKSCAAVQSSYRQLPNDVIQPRCSGRHPDAAAALNDYYVSKPTGGENQPSGGDHGGANTAGGRLKSIYNENLQKSEDDLFELDMMIATNDAARKRLEQLYKSVMQRPQSTKQGKAAMIEIPPVEKRAISRLYSEHGNKVLNLLKKMPETTIPVVLKRLREKSNEWQQLKNEMKIVWKSVAKKNYFKAHDFRYTIFKQYDTKRITLKNICKQIEERHVATQRRLFGAGMAMNGNVSTKEKEEVSDEEEENEDIDVDGGDGDGDGDVLQYGFDFDGMHDGERKMDVFAVDFESSAIASTGSGVMVNGNGVICGVGLIGNASHDYIIQQMGAGLHVELGDFVCGKGRNWKMNNYDYRFVLCKPDILRDCARFVLQHANTSEVGKERKEKKLFAEILESIFKQFWGIDIREQCVEFLQNDIDSEEEEEDHSPSTPSNANKNSADGSVSTVYSPDPISKIMRNIDVQNESALKEVKVGELEKENESVGKYLAQYLEDGDQSNEGNVLLFGNKTIYALFRYLHFLYSRMNFAYRLCKSANPLYGKSESEEEMQRKYKDFLSHLSKLINGQIEEEIFEDECRKLLGIKSYELFTIHRVIRYVYDRICDFDTDGKVHEFYKLFLYFKAKAMTKEHRIKYFVAASKISNDGNKPEELYQIEYAQNKILAISLSDKYKSNININDDVDMQMSDNNNTKQ